MTDNSTSVVTSVASAPTRSNDQAWAHGQVVLGGKNSTICVHCGKKINGGGITRLKYHLAGVKGQVEYCKEVPPKVKWQMKQLVEDLIKEKEKRKRLRYEIGNSRSNDEGDSVNPIPTPSKAKVKLHRICVDVSMDLVCVVIDVI